VSFSALVPARLRSRRLALAGVAGTACVGLIALTAVNAYASDLIKFAPKVDYATGTSPTGLAAGDVNGDGKIDVITTNRDGNTVSILYGNGDGTFPPKRDLPLPGGPFDVRIGDLNGDGKPDLVVTDAAPAANTLSIFIGHGDGSFASPVNYPLPVNPTAVRLVDINADGKLDVLTSNFDSNNVSVLFGNGDGTVQAAVNYATGLKPRTIGLGDLNGDHKLDLVTPNADGDSMSVLLGNGDGTFQAQHEFSTGAGTRPRDVVVADFNGDGKLDLGIAALNGGFITEPGNGDGTFGTPTVYKVGTNPTALVVADFNSDSHLDAVVANLGSGTVSVLAGRGDGTFDNPVDFATGANPLDLVAVDANGDGKTDVITADAGASLISVLLNSTTHNVAPVAKDDSHSGYAGKPVTVAAPGVLANDSDANGDKLTVRLVTGPKQGTVTLNPDGSFTYKSTATASGTDSFTYVANDGQADSAPATVTIALKPVPVARPDSYTINHPEDGLEVGPPGVLANDTGANGATLVPRLVMGTHHGVLTFNPDGSFVYIPLLRFRGKDTFTYVVSDGTIDSEPTTVTIQVGYRN
jgi:hypothetical protein